MSGIPTISAALARIDATISSLDRARDRIMLEVFRDHWLAEVRNDVPAIMATLPEKLVSYRFDGVGLMIPEKLEFHRAEDARRLYQGAADGGLPMAGPFEDERWAFADWGMTFEGVNVAIVRGRSLHGVGRTLHDDALYLSRWRSMSAHPIDVDRALMLGEHVYTGSILSIEEVDEAAVTQMLQ